MSAPGVAHRLRKNVCKEGKLFFLFLFERTEMKMSVSPRPTRGSSQLHHVIRDNVFRLKQRIMWDLRNDNARKKECY